MAEILKFENKKKIVTEDVEFTGSFIDNLINEVNLFDFYFQIKDASGNISDITGFYLNPDNKTITLYSE